jgi:flagellar hook-basal body complex protein FliE
MTAINTYAMSLITYTSGIIKWTNTDLNNLNTLTRTTCTKFQKHHQHTAVERFTLPRKGGRECIDILNAHHKQTENLRQYFISQQDRNLHKAIIAIENSSTPLSTIHSDVEKTESWKNEIIHGKHPYQLSLEYVDKEASNMWLRKGQPYAETEGFAIAIQDQVINTKNYLKHVIKDNSIIDDKC